MKVHELIEYVKRAKPSALEDNDLYGWLNDVECQVYNYINKRIEDMGEVPVYEQGSEKELLINNQYKDVYAWYVKAQIDINADDIEKYTNSMIMFNTYWENWTADFNSQHMVKKVNRIKV